MSRFHDKASGKVNEVGDKGGHLNWMGGKSFDISNPIARLRLAASSCFFGEPMYYHSDPEDTRPQKLFPSSALSLGELIHLRETLNSIEPSDWRGKTPVDLMESAIDDALKFDAELTLKEAVRLRNEEHIRTTPQVILVLAANHKAVRGTGLVQKYAPEIIKRADEPSVGLAYQLWKYQNKPIPNALKKAWKKALEGFSEYALSKYKMTNKGVKTVDVVNLVHPKSEAINKLVHGQLTLSDQTWESIISAKGSSRETWEEAIDVMGHMALLRNIRNMLQKGVPEDLFVKKLVDGAKDGKQLPFRYMSAYEAIGMSGGGSIRDAIEECLEVSMGNLPKFQGRLMALSDNSGSAHGAMTSIMGTMSVARIANLTSVIAAKQSDDGYVGAFGDTLKVVPVRKKSSVIDQARVVDDLGQKVGGGTEHGIWLFWDKAIKEKEHWDHVFVFSDMQAGHGGLYGTSGYDDYRWSGTRNIDVPKLISKYRKSVNPDVMVYLVQMAGYQDTIVPEYYDKTYILGGWGEGLLRFAAAMSGQSAK